MTGVIRSREAGRIAGVDAIRLVLSRLPEPASATIVAADGTDVAAGGTVALLTGSARTLLTGERVILNLLGRLSGIATATAAVVRAVEGTGVAIKDTRKTTPGLRLLEKYAVACGGGVNHRSGLYDAVLIKDNHIGVAGSITAAVEPRAREPRQAVPDPGRGRHARAARRSPRLRRDVGAPRQHGARAVAARRGSASIAAATSRRRAASRSRTCAPSPKPASIRSRSAG